MAHSTLLQTDNIREGSILVRGFFHIYLHVEYLLHAETQITVTYI
jgi:hypothetical protein